MAIQDLSASLDLKQNLNIYAPCKQFDSLNLILSIYDNSVSVDISAYSVRLRAMKYDKVPLIQENVGISKNGNTVTIEANEQLTTTAGNTPIELQFIDKSGKKKATFNLVLVIVPSTVAVDASISKATYTLLEELENKIDQCSDFFESIDTAKTANNNLKSTITNSETAKTNLDKSISTGNITKSNLDNSIKEGNAVIEEIKEKNVTYTEHINNLDIHVTKADKDKWDLTTLNLKQVINLIDKSIGKGTLLDENGQPLTDEDSIEFLG